MSQTVILSGCIIGRIDREEIYPQMSKPVYAHSYHLVDDMVAERMRNPFQVSQTVIKSDCNIVWVITGGCIKARGTISMCTMRAQRQVMRTAPGVIVSRNVNTSNCSNNSMSV